MQNRVISLDVFRGLTVMLMTLVNNPGDWGHIYAPFEHAKWHGCTEGTNLAAYVDNLVLPGHLWAVSKTWDPEGILSTIPAIATGIIGLIAGTQLRKTCLLGISGLILLVIGFVWDLAFPMNKALWTSSFVGVTAGWALLSFAILRYLVDEKNLTTFIAPILLFGMHPMLVFFFSGIIPRALNMIKIGDQGFVGWMYQ